MQTISITRALAELKRIDERLTKSINSSPFVGLTVGRDNQRKPATGNQTLVELTSQLQSNRDSVDSLFRQRQAIKAAIVKSNAVTTITIGGQTMTVAEAIELKRSIEFKRLLVAQLKTQIMRTNQTVDQHNQRLQIEIETNLQAIYGSEKTKLDSTAYDSVATPKLSAREASLFDPTNVTKYVETLDEEISLIDTELDFTLSESNARTEITF